MHPWNLTKALSEAGVPIHYVGAQCHDDLSFYSDFPGYIDSVKRYSRSVVELGVQWHFTEITVGLDEAGGDFMTEEEQTTQAGRLSVCFVYRVVHLV